MNLKNLFSQNILEVAKLPKNNNIDVSTLDSYKLLVIPIDHDYPGGSSAMHNAVFEKYLPEYRTVFVVADPNNAKTIFETFKNDPLYVGGGVGSGFKDKAISYLDELDDSAKITGSVNVVTKRDGKLIGYNTDGVGFLQGLKQEFPNSVTDKYVVLLGAGGTALPIAYELAKEHPKQIAILNRTISKAQHLAEKISPYTESIAGGEDAISQYMKTADLVINTSNKGAHPFKDYTAFAPITNTIEEHMAIAKKNISQLPKHAIVADILLEDLSSTLALAKEQGYSIHNGKSMNLYQAVPALKIMAPLEHVTDATLENIMRNAL